jgi:dimeric dUTPase (all-alpha-NTP-PPase superfamily)
MSEKEIKYDATIKLLLELQDKMNKVVDENWVELNRDWCRAIWIESAELMDHLSWKWWKKQTPDVEQMHLELVDILHFGLSDMIVQANISDLTWEVVADRASRDITNAYLIERLVDEITDLEYARKVIENFTLKILQNKRFDYYEFACLCNTLGLTFAKLSSMYISKNVLNIFRQNNGYKDGTYEKTWFGKEDNVHLMEIFNEVNDSEESDMFNSIYSKLDDIYTKHLIREVPV